MSASRPASTICAPRCRRDGIEAAAQAIGTTDTYPKGAGTTVMIDGQPVHIAGIAKGSGMIAPDMATMLVYIFTDAAIDQQVLQDTVSALNRTTFNCITVDSDTSTSDTLLVAATGASGIRVTENNVSFMEGLWRVMLDLAHQVVRDGEGATKFIEISVTGAASDAEAHRHAKAIANSPLVKTAVAGEDPNWGRVVMAVGKSGARADRDLLAIWFGDISGPRRLRQPRSRRGPRRRLHEERRDRDPCRSRPRRRHGAVWTCDLTHGYIDINADYRS